VEQPIGQSPRPEQCCIGAAILLGKVVVVEPPIVEVAGRSRELYQPSKRLPVLERGCGKSCCCKVAHYSIRRLPVGSSLCDKVVRDERNNLTIAINDSE
jgi:hypothetical protein